MLPLPDGIEMIFVSRLELLNVLDEIDAGALPPTDSELSAYDEGEDESSEMTGHEYCSPSPHSDMNISLDTACSARIGMFSMPYACSAKGSATTCAGGISSVGSDGIFGPET